MTQRTVQIVLDEVYQALEAAEIYAGHGVDNAWDEAVFLVLYAMGLPLDSDQSVLSLSVNADQYAQIQYLFKQRAIEKKPLAYLMKKAWFAGLEFDVDERVLIPRSPIAELIESQFEPWVESSKIKRVLDLCTGSGCIGIACAHYLPKAQVDLSDISEDALNLACQNIAKHKLKSRVNAIQSDCFDAIEPKQQYDIIVSNPPYVDEADLASMPDEFHHEPVLGLASGKDGLDLTRRILKQAKDYLTDEGVLIVEVGNSQFALAEAYPDVPFVWLEFERGGDGVFLLTKHQLIDMMSV